MTEQNQKQGLQELDGELVIPTEEPQPFVDCLQREFCDDLSEFLQVFLNTQSNRLFVPFINPLAFVEGVTGLTIYRSDPFQVQLFIVNPNVEIHEHQHPNVDSYEVALCGMRFTYRGQELKTFWDTADFQGLPKGSYLALRVRPEDKHGAFASDQGGAFLSVQRWLNGVRPTSVGNDWEGKRMGKIHKSMSEG